METLSEFQHPEGKQVLSGFTSSLRQADLRNDVDVSHYSWDGKILCVCGFLADKCFWRARRVNDFLLSTTCVVHGTSMKIQVPNVRCRKSVKGHDPAKERVSFLAHIGAFSPDNTSKVKTRAKKEIRSGIRCCGAPFP